MQYDFNQSWQVILRDLRKSNALSLHDKRLILVQLQEMKEVESHIECPDDFKIVCAYDHRKCDVIQGHCACGAYHTLADFLEL